MKISAETIQRWRLIAEEFCAQQNLPLTGIKTGREAWFVAHQTGICREAYLDRSVLDAHIQTALEHIFPNAVFLDPKRY